MENSKSAGVRSEIAQNRTSNAALPAVVMSDLIVHSFTYMKSVESFAEDPEVRNAGETSGCNQVQHWDLYLSFGKVLGNKMDLKYRY